MRIVKTHGNRASGGVGPYYTRQMLGLPPSKPYDRYSPHHRAGSENYVATIRCSFRFIVAPASTVSCSDAAVPVHNPNIVIAGSEVIDN